MDGESQGLEPREAKLTKYIELAPETKFLLVDEGQGIRDALAMGLRSMGLKHTLHAKDAHSAMKILESLEVNFVICDRGLRNVSGIEFLREVRECPYLANIPFLMMAPEITKEEIALASEFGIDGYLQKPFAMRELSTKISAAMARYLDPVKPEKQFDAARKAMCEANYTAAIEMYKQLQAKFPDSARTRVGLARCYHSLGRDGDAQAELESAIDRNPNYVHAYHQLGVLHLANGHVQKALVNFDAAINLSPLNPIRYEAIGEILIREKNFEGAEDYLSRAIKLELAYPNIFSQLGKVLFSQKKMDKAIKYFEKALVYEPSNTSFLNSLGICMKEIGRYDDALKYYNIALKISQSDTKVLFNKSLCLIQMNEIDRARKTLRSILAIDPGYDKAQEKLEQLGDVGRPQPKQSRLVG
jgi:tetratricopeptide (TPR) repeat protein